MVLDRLRAEHEPLGDLAVGEMVGHEPRDLELAAAQVREHPLRVPAASRLTDVLTLRSELSRRDCLEPVRTELTKLDVGFAQKLDTAVVASGGECSTGEQSGPFALQRVPGSRRPHCLLRDVYRGRRSSVGDQDLRTGP